MIKQNNKNKLKWDKSMILLCVCYFNVKLIGSEQPHGGEILAMKKALIQKVSK